jgi:hypothetical protein
VPLEPYAHYAELGNQNANSRWGKRLRWFVAGFAIVGVVAFVVATGSVAGAVFGAAGGAALGYGIFRLVLYGSAASSADDLYQADWCKERGMRSVGDDYFPNNAPYAKSGDSREAKDAFEGSWNGLDTLFYNFTYTDETNDSSTDYDFKIMRLTGRELPIRRLSIHRRSAINKFAMFDKLEAALTPERSISLESVGFNEKFDLTIDDGADEIWIRRIFDPATIAALLDGSFTIPDVKYYDRAWWFVEREHFDIKDLDEWIPKQKVAANAVDLLSRVQNL